VEWEIWEGWEGWGLTLEWADSDDEAVG